MSKISCQSLQPVSCARCPPTPHLQPANTSTLCKTLEIVFIFCRPTFGQRSQHDLGYAYNRIEKCIITEDCWDNDDAGDAKPSEEPQHCEHDVGCRKSTCNSKEHSRHIRHQQHDPPAKPTESQRNSKILLDWLRHWVIKCISWMSSSQAVIPVTQTSKGHGSKHHSNKEDGGSCFVFPSSITYQVPLVQTKKRKRFTLLFVDKRCSWWWTSRVGYIVFYF